MIDTTWSLTFLRSVEPDVVFVAGLAPSGLAILREARRQRLPAAFVGGDGGVGIGDDTTTAEGAYVATPFTRSESGPAVARFVAAFEQRFHAEPAEDAALGYDAARLLAAAVAARGRSRAGVREYLAALDAEHPYVGVTGPFRFLTSGDPAGREFVITRVHRGSYITASD